MEYYATTTRRITMPTDEEREAVQKGRDKALKEIDAEREKRDKLFDKYQAENYKVGGKFEAWVEVLKHADSPTDARTVIDALIEKERRQALKHARKGLELLQTMPPSIAGAAEELAEAAKKLQQIAGKEIVKGFF
jgi:hypothetical protein